MSSKLTVFVCFQALALQGVFAQVIVPRYVPSPVVEAVLPSCGCQQLVPQLVSPVSAPVVLQDSSVSNSLANALQLLVVSNLLSTTLPQSEILVPYAAAPCGGYCGPSVVSPVLPSCGCGLSALNAFGGFVNVL